LAFPRSGVAGEGHKKTGASCLDGRLCCVVTGKSLSKHKIPDRLVGFLFLALFLGDERLRLHCLIPRTAGNCNREYTGGEGLSNLVHRTEREFDKIPQAGGHLRVDHLFLADQNVQIAYCLV